MKLKKTEQLQLFSKIIIIEKDGKINEYLGIYTIVYGIEIPLKTYDMTGNAILQAYYIEKEEEGETN